jgi:cell wall-associated NlpC family hydrolase
VYASASEYSASTGNEIVDRAYSMLGSSYRYGGTGADGSFDCSGLVGYALTGTNERIGNTLTFMEYNQVSDPQPGDIVVSEGHTGIYIGDGQMIHAQDEEHGVVVGKVQDDMIYVRP